MAIIVINHFSDGLKDYKSAFEGYEGEVIFITSLKNKNAYKNVFQNRVIIDDFYKDDRLQLYISDLAKIKKIEKIIATHEFDLEKIGRLRDELFIDGQSERSALQFRDKYLMKSTLNGKVKLPKYQLIENMKDIDQAISNIGFPLVLKPLDGAGAIGVDILTEHQSIEILKKQFPLLAEEYIDGNEMFHVDGIFQNNKIILAKPSKYENGCLAYKENLFVGSIMLDDKDEMNSYLIEESNKILQNMQTPAHAFAFHIEFFYKNNELIFCEAACRVGGTKINETFLAKTGVDLFVESIKAQLYDDYSISNHKIVEENYVYGGITIPFQSGKLIDINKECPFDWVVMYAPKIKKIGNYFNGGDSSASEVISAIIKGSSFEDVKSKMWKFDEWSKENCIWEK
ncbi:ATP-grasp domain-containing protein [Enterococcus sp. BWB1-3]|uniref:ATP-grasp domain-containing protein n=1 Tax=Enterococcus sp. BWB1-3 TaxID=2787713 RepID=UPI001923FD99|nr:ATP-grasp domain-containing protein [Enterococcus sp. BWB1-3]MBL1228440.1 ATP-grasp domain-containing protein [Enterococcus sp. BWB1-3]